MYLGDFAEILSERQDIREEHQHKVVFSKSSRYGRLAQVTGRPPITPFKIQKCRIVVANARGRAWSRSN